MNSRQDKILSSINIKKSRGLELGPLHRPTVTKLESEIYYLDHASREDLVIKYTGHGFNLDDIVDVDYVLGDKGLKDSVDGKKFDYVIASHVIEHIPDTISWLDDIESILNKNGLLSLVIPDKRYCFDVARNTSSPADVIGAYYDKLVRPSSTMMYDAWAEFRDLDPVSLWIQGDGIVTDEPTTDRINDGWKKTKQNLKNDTYIDAHCHTFTPKSFFRILDRLIYHKLLSFEVVDFYDTAQNEQEFFVTLKKVSKKDAKTRAETFKFNESDGTAKLEEKVADLELRLSDLSVKLTDITASSSWKVTKPLRQANKLRGKIIGQ